MIQMLLEHPAFGEHDLSSLRTLLYAASPMSQALLERVLGALPRVALTQAYGMTELAPIVTLLTPADHRAGTQRRSVGRAAAHAEVRVVDGDDNEVPSGTVGEIVARGGNVMLGYWNRPEETAVSSHPAVAACAVIAVPDARWGERVHAVIVAKPRQQTTAEEIRAHCETLIAAYKAPRSCEFVDALPLSPAGKVLKHELRRPWREGMDRQVG
jgi:acyl-CoA synthetase (AMP-forming)/AMP-acid ligase II